MPDQQQDRVPPKHGPGCTLRSLEPLTMGEPIDYDKLCVGYHCPRCGEPCSSHGHSRCEPVDGEIARA